MSKNNNCGSNPKSFPLTGYTKLVKYLSGIAAPSYDPFRS
ncbi:hypothetical protein TNCV_3687111, partial [Trichonephila clavipes]